MVIRYEGIEFEAVDDLIEYRKKMQYDGAEFGTTSELKEYIKKTTKDNYKGIQKPKPKVYTKGPNPIVMFPSHKNMKWNVAKAYREIGSMDGAMDLSVKDLAKQVVRFLSEKGVTVNQKGNKITVDNVKAQIKVMDGAGRKEATTLIKVLKPKAEIRTRYENKSKPWRKTELKELKKLYASLKGKRKKVPRGSMEYIAKKIGRTPYSIRNQLRLM